MNNMMGLLMKAWGIKALSKMLGRRRNRGMMWMSLIGIGISAAATIFGLGRNRNKNMLRPLQNVMNGMRSRTANQMPNAAAMAEFAKDIIPDVTKK